jgi:AcrR family transcriptional regulator
VRRACLGSYAAELRQRLARVAEGEGGAVAAGIEAFHESVRANPALFRLCLELRLVAAAQVRAIHRELVDLLAQHLRRLGLAGGEAPAAARALLAALDGLVLQAVVEPGEPAVGAAHRVVGEWVSAKPRAEEGGSWSSTACGR